MILINSKLKSSALQKKIDRLWQLSAEKLTSLDKSESKIKGSPVYTVKGKYTSRGWTEWTQGFQFGMGLLHFDATGEKAFLEKSKEKILRMMPVHITHFGVHDHGFNNISTYGNLLRLAVEGKYEASNWEKDYYSLAIRCSGAIQARRWSDTGNNTGYVYSFNGPHSLFADTIRSLRALGSAWRLGQRALGENDAEINLLDRLIMHALTTAKYAVYYGEGRDAYDLRGRVAHESIFNMNDGRYRCPNSQQGYSPFSTWTRGLAWIMLGFAEQLEFLETVPDAALEKHGGKKKLTEIFLKAATATCDFYIEHSPTDGIPYWDTGAPMLHKLGNYLDKPADPFNEHEPVDSSAAAIGIQALLRLGKYLEKKDKKAAAKYFQAGLTSMDSLLSEPYISTKSAHQGLILHSVYHRPNNWDYIPDGAKIPLGESSMWGDYHAMETALYIQKLNKNEEYLKFFI